MIKFTRVPAAALAIATAVAVPAVGIVGSSTAAQAVGSNTHYKGEVVAKTLSIRSQPTTYGMRVGTLKEGAKVTIWCKVEAVPVAGNRLWYTNGKGQWYPARYVENLGKAPVWCGGRWWDWGTAIKKSSVNLRQGPTNQSKLVGTVRYGKNVSIICKVNGPNVDGNPRWYQLEDGRFVAARYVKNAPGMIPPYCNR